MSKQKIRDISGKVIGEIDENVKSVYESIQSFVNNVKIPELHLSTNFMGPFTQNDERLSLNWKGKRRARVDYFLPVDRDDYASFKHDLYYYVPNNVIKSYADWDMIYDLFGYTDGNLYRKLAAIQFITGAYSFRILRQMGYAGLYLTASAQTTRDIVNLVRSRPELSYTERFQRNVLYPLFVFGAGFFGRPVKYMKDSLKTIYDIFTETEEFKKIDKAHSEVVNKYDKYLREVGKFKYVLIKDKKEAFKDLFLNPTRQKFEVKKNINKDKAEKLYEEFYNEFNEYKKLINEIYKDLDGFKPHDIIPLNKENLDLVSSPYDLGSSKYRIYTDENIINLMKQLKAVATVENAKKIAEKIKLLTKKKELKEEVIKVLEGKILEPFETPAPELEEYKKEKEKEIEIEKVLKGEIEKPFETPIPAELDFFKKLQQEEIKKVLEKEIETPFETPIQLNVPTDADFFKSFQQQQQI